MFGYVRPLLPELTIQDFQRFRAAYCGVCHELGRSCGPAARMILSYDFVFLYMLLYRNSRAPELKIRRCPVAPVKGRCVAESSPELKKAAAQSLILACKKAEDDRADEKAGKRLGAAGVLAVLSGALRRAREAESGYYETVSEKLSQLAEMEKQGEKSLDRAADAFASLLAAASEDRIISQILYHTGRIIYIADGADDLARDAEAGRYNPVAMRFGIGDGRLTDEARDGLRRTLQGSLAVLAADFELLEESWFSGVLGNIIYLGLPDMCERVLTGTWKPDGRGPRDKDIYRMGEGQ